MVPRLQGLRFPDCRGAGSGSLRVYASTPSASACSCTGGRFVVASVLPYWVEGCRRLAGATGGVFCPGTNYQGKIKPAIKRAVV
jgi:hypothetical protein